MVQDKRGWKTGRGRLKRYLPTHKRMHHVLSAANAPTSRDPEAALPHILAVQSGAKIFSAAGIRAKLPLRKRNVLNEPDGQRVSQISSAGRASARTKTGCTVTQGSVEAGALFVALCAARYLDGL